MIVFCRRGGGRGLEMVAGEEGVVGGEGNYADENRKALGGKYCVTGVLVK